MTVSGESQRQLSSITQLPAVMPGESLENAINADHPMRVITEDLVRDEDSWSASTAKSTAHVFDCLAETWDERFADRTARLAPLVDALERGGPINFGAVADIGAGTLVTTDFLQTRFDTAVGLDLSFEMLRQRTSPVAGVHSDASRLPFGDDAFDAVVLMNAFLFPSEVDRVLRTDGVVVWVSSIGPSTPIYLSPGEVASALPGEWGGVWSTAGIGTWSVLRRT